MAAKIWAGLDVGVERTSVSIINDLGEVLHEATCATTLRSIHAELKGQKRRRHFKVGLEAAGGLTIARGLRTLGYSVDMYETRRLSKFLRIRRNKTDAGDALGIAEAGRIGGSLISKVHLKNLECQSLQSILTMRRLLIRERVRTVNLLCRQLEFFGGRVSRGSTKASCLRNAVEAEIQKLFGRVADPLTTELRYLVEHPEHLLVRQQRLDRDLRSMANGNEVCRRFMGIPGVGPLCALTFYAAVDEPERFSRASDIGAYFGLTPRLDQSGLTCRAGRISKMGNKAVRSLLVHASLQFMRCSHADTRLRLWAARLEERRGRQRARIALARKLAVIMIAMWKTGEPFTQAKETAGQTAIHPTNTDLGGKIALLARRPL